MIFWKLNVYACACANDEDPVLNSILLIYSKLKCTELTVGKFTDLEMRVGEGERGAKQSTSESVTVGESDEPLSTVSMDGTLSSQVQP